MEAAQWAEICILLDAHSPCRSDVIDDACCGCEVEIPEPYEVSRIGFTITSTDPKRVPMMGRISEPRRWSSQ